MVRHIRVVHISGIVGDTNILTDLLDAQRVLVDETDRTETGIIDPEARIAASITYLRRLQGQQ